MPNWTSNRIHIKGHPADIRDFLDKVRSQDQLFDFGRIIPMPDLLRRTSLTFDRKGRASRYVIREAAVEAHEETRAFTDEEAAFLRDIGYFNWYDWSIAKWGTKWNAFRVEIDESRITGGEIEISFETAWSAPEPVFRGLIARFTNLIFTFRWRDEDDPDRLHTLCREDDGDSQ